MIHRNLEFEAALCADFADAFNGAYKCASKKPHAFVTSLYERYAEALSNGAHFYGPLAVIPQEGSKHWTIRDMRHGWGYYPLDVEVYTESEFPTEADIMRALRGNAQNLRERAKAMDELVEFFQKPEQA